LPPGEPQYWVALAREHFAPPFPGGTVVTRSRAQEESACMQSS
jgi:hypothetical protein